MTTGTKRMETIADLGIGKPQTVLNLTMFPLSGNPAAALAYLLVDEALKKKEVVVEEVSEGGTVPEIRVTNFSLKAVLVVDGTELVGAKQNRIVNASFLLPPKSVTKIPVSCVEQGRWNYRGKNFQRSPHHAAHSIRRLNVMHHKETLKSRRGYGSDQGQVWAHVAQMSHAAIVAREYGIPAVMAASGATKTLTDGDEILVDGSRGVVVRTGAGK